MAFPHDLMRSRVNPATKMTGQGVMTSEVFVATHHGASEGAHTFGSSHESIMTTRIGAPMYREIEPQTAAAGEFGCVGIAFPALNGRDEQDPEPVAFAGVAMETFDPLHPGASIITVQIGGKGMMRYDGLVACGPNTLIAHRLPKNAQEAPRSSGVGMHKQVVPIHYPVKPADQGAILARIDGLTSGLFDGPTDQSKIAAKFTDFAKYIERLNETHDLELPSLPALAEGAADNVVEFVRETIDVLVRNAEPLDSAEDGDGELEVMWHVAQVAILFAMMTVEDETVVAPGLNAVSRIMKQVVIGAMQLTSVDSITRRHRIIGMTLGMARPGGEVPMLFGRRGL